MDIKDKIELVKANIWKAIDDYKAHTKQTEVLDDITDTFVGNLAEDNISAKRELRELFRTSPAWNEELDALVINGTRTHNPDYDRVNELAEDILAPARACADNETYETISRAIRFFTRPKSTREERQEAIEAIQNLAQNAYAPNKKHSRIFKALCDALEVSDDAAGSKFQRQYAQFADEITSRKIPFKLYVSLSAAHFLTMSNPKADRRGDMMTSCHSLNSTQYEYNCGCTGYGRDEFTFIVFTATDPDDPSTLNSRKNSRQIFAYKPGNGLLLQSRLYNTFGGTCGAQEDSKLYRDLVQREISELEEAANLWRTYNYFGNNHCTIPSGIGFGGYPDWTYKCGNILMSPQGIGGDDRCGVYGIVKVYEATEEKPWLLFTCDEEIGGRGADGFCAAHLKGELPERLNELKMLVELDRKGKNDAVYYSCDNPAFEEYITSKGFRTARGSFSDISSIAPCLGVAAVNLSCGYYNAHTLHECINRKHLNATVRKVIGMVSDAEKPDFPKYDFIRSQRNYYYGSLWDDPYADWEGYESGAMTGEPPKDLAPEYKELYEELLDIYEPEELDYFRMEYGDPILRELYEQEYYVNTGRR